MLDTIKKLIICFGGLKMNDTERLNWLEQKQGGAVISDDFGSWAFAADGMQNIPDDPPADTWTSFLLQKLPGNHP